MAPKLEEKGIVFKDAGQPKDIFAIFKDHGATCIRLRLFVDPSGEGAVVNDLPYTIALAKRVKSAGLLFSLDLHYSDTWADPGHQKTPAAWRDLTFPKLVDQVRDYTATTLTAFRDAGVTPDVVQIGNEITNGLLWPQGVIGGTRGHRADFDHVAELLKAGVAGFHLALGDDTATKIMIHVDGGDDPDPVKWFFDGITRAPRPVRYDRPELLSLLGRIPPQPEKVVGWRRPRITSPSSSPKRPIPSSMRRCGKASARVSIFPSRRKGQKAYLEALIRIVQ